MTSISPEDLQVFQSDLNDVVSKGEAAISCQHNCDNHYDKQYLRQLVVRHSDHHAKIREHGRLLLFTYWTHNLKMRKLTTKMACHDITYPGDFKMLINTMRLEGKMDLESRLVVARKFLRAFIRHVDKYKKTTMAFFITDTANEIIDPEENSKSFDSLFKILDKDEQFVILSYMPEMKTMALKKDIKDLTKS